MHRKTKSRPDAREATGCKGKRDAKRSNGGEKKHGAFLLAELRGEAAKGKAESWRTFGPTEGLKGEHMKAAFRQKGGLGDTE